MSCARWEVASTLSYLTCCLPFEALLALDAVFTEEDDGDDEEQAAQHAGHQDHDGQVAPEPQRRRRTRRRLVHGRPATSSI